MYESCPFRNTNLGSELFDTFINVPQSEAHFEQLLDACMNVARLENNKTAFRMFPVLYDAAIRLVYDDCL